MASTSPFKFPALHSLLFRLALALLLLATARGAAQEAAPQPGAVRQRLDDAWWTGPMLAAGAGTLPHGHFLVEPYVYDVHSGNSHSVGTLSYVQYGLADRVTVGMIPTAGLNVVRDGTNSSGVGLGDVAATAQYRLTQFHEGSWIPTASIVVQETFPTGRYDRLGHRPSDGLGGGAYTTMVALYAQTYFWLGNGRILRMRVDASESMSSDATIRDVSVYGTTDGFRGRASPGNSFYLITSWEYSLTRSWVLALDATYRQSGSTEVIGQDITAPGGSPGAASVRSSSGSRDELGFAPGIEYSWKPTIGVLLATRVIPSGHNTSSSITPAIAINMVY